MSCYTFRKPLSKIIRSHVCLHEKMAPTHSRLVSPLACHQECDERRFPPEECPDPPQIPCTTEIVQVRPYMLTIIGEIMASNITCACRPLALSIATVSPSSAARTIPSSPTCCRSASSILRPLRDRFTGVISAEPIVLKLRRPCASLDPHGSIIGVRAMPGE